MARPTGGGLSEREEHARANHDAILRVSFQFWRAASRSSRGSPFIALIVQHAEMAPNLCSLRLDGRESWRTALGGSSVVRPRRWRA
eukprot:8249582-Pyramimonas_sp.AAC.1